LSSDYDFLQVISGSDFSGPLSEQNQNTC